MEDHARFPFVSEFLEERYGTLYVLCDDRVRIRDAVSVVALTRFFAAAGVKLDVHPVQTNHQRYLSAYNIKKSLTAKHVQDFKRDLERGEELGALLEKVFGWVETRQVTEWNEVLVPRGPIVVLGRPQLYPESFQERILEELTASSRSLNGRYITPSNELGSPAFHSIVDQAYDVTHIAESDRRDFGIIRKVQGLFRNRVLLFAYGTSSLGTIGAAQMLIDRDHNERLCRGGIGEHFKEHGETEILVEVTLPQGRLGATVIGAAEGELHPRELRVFVGPSPPVSKVATRWIAMLTSGPEDPEVKTVYTRTGRKDLTEFEVTGVHPQDALSTQMIGGELVKGVVERLKRLGTDPGRQPVLLCGPTGVGKELASRIVFEWRVIALLTSMRRSGFNPRAEFGDNAALGAYLTTINCSGMTDLAESRLFGIRKGSATGVSASPGVILGAGEGVAFLDELSFMNEVQQARLLRALEPPFEILPFGMERAVSYPALIVAAMSSNPESPVEERGLLPELYARLHAGRVSIPSLAERPGDVPALLAAFLGRPIEMDENVLRCLLSDRHRDNVRGLYAIVSRARGTDTADDRASVEIRLEHLGDSGYLQQGVGWPRQGGVRRFRFVPPVPRGIPWTVFRDFAHVLTSLVGMDDRLVVRTPLNDGIATGFGVKGYSSVAEAASVWVGAVRNAKAAGVPREALKKAGRLLVGCRFGEQVPGQFTNDLATAFSGLTNADNRNIVTQQDIADSLGKYDGSGISRTMKRIETASPKKT